MHVKGKPSSVKERWGWGGWKGQECGEVSLQSREFPSPINHIPTLSQNLPFLSTPPAPPTLNNFHVGSHESQNLSPCYQSVTFPIYLLHCCQSIFLNTSLIIVSAAYLTKSQTQHGTQGLRSSGPNWTVPIASPFCISSCSTACFPISFIHVQRPWSFTWIFTWTNNPYLFCFMFKFTSPSLPWPVLLKLPWS